MLCPYISVHGSRCRQKRQHGSHACILDGFESEHQVQHVTVWGVVGFQDTHITVSLCVGSPQHNNLIHLHNVAHFSTLMVGQSRTLVLRLKTRSRCRKDNNLEALMCLSVDAPGSAP